MATFSDIQTNWARLFIEALAQRGIISGFSNGTFRPNESMTRAQFAAVVSKAFDRPKKRQYVSFADVPSKYWAAAAIQKAYESGFLSGYADKSFRPEERISRVQVLVSLVSGLGLTSNRTAEIKAALPQMYQDAGQIPGYAVDSVAIATSLDMVANFPNLKLFNPNGAATRADVSAFIYQALAELGKAPDISSQYIVRPPVQTVAVSHRRELRGAWVTTVWNRDWPSKLGLSVEQQKAELITILDQLQAMNFNALVLQLRAEGDALYNSQLEPWSYWLTGTPGKPPEPFYDPLEFAVAECHKRNIEFHAWFNLYRARVSLTTPPPVSPHISVTNPEYVYKYGSNLWMDPGAKVVQDRSYNVILDVVRRYDVDAIHVDDYYYPYPITGEEFPDSKTYEAYKSAGNQSELPPNLSLADWRRENVNRLIQRLATGIRAAKPNVKFGISPFGIYRPGQPSQIRGLDSYEVIYTDTKKWLEQGWLDYFSPQLYWRTDQTAQSYPVLLNWWLEQNPKRKHIYVGNNLGQLDGKSWQLSEIQKQVEITRGAADKLALGNFFYSMSAFEENRQGIFDDFKTSTYAQPALVPVMSWLNTKPPAIPARVRLREGQLSWSSAGTPNIRSWTLYQQNGSTWTLLKILPVQTTSVTVQRGTYALCAVDQLANESAGVVIRY